MRPPRALAARGALLGATGGVAAGLIDFAQAASRARAFLPVGQWKLALFLTTLYGAAGAIALAATGLLLGAIFWATDAGPLWQAAFAGEEHEGGRWAAYALVGVAALVGMGLVLDPIALEALRRYHHHGLIAAVVAAAAAGLFVAAALVTLVGGAALSPLLRVGPRARLRFVAPAGLEAASWVLGLYGGAAAVAGIVFRLEERTRMAPAFKAHNTALWAPVMMAAWLLAAHLVARKLPMRERLLKTPRGALVAVASALASPLLLIAVVEWPLVRQLDLRPFVALAVAFAAVVALMSVDFNAPLRKQPLWLRTLVAVATPALLLAIALGVGRLDRVRKAAAAFTGATGPIVGVLQAATDLDHDGYSSILGGGDCDDFDREVHPGAFDWPDDGIDQDCNGHQATLATPPRAPFAAVPASVPRDANVVLITIDALRADHLGMYGYARPTSPRLDALAAQSVRFADAWAHAPSTRYSIPAILTGRYPSTIATDATLHWPPAILPDNRLVAEMLHDRGFYTGATASYGGSGYFEPGWGVQQGFDEFDTHLKSLHSIAGDPSNTRGTSSRQLADLDVDWIGKHKDKRFFFWTHFYDTHYGFERHPDMPESSFGNNEIDLYDGEIRFTDFHIGRVLDALKAAGLWDKTIVIVTADHGDGFGEHGIPVSQRHGYHLYENETKVPLIIHVPGLPPRVVRSPVGHVDIVPTILNLIGAKAGDEPTLLGRSLVGLLDGSAPDDDRGEVFQEVTYEGPASRYDGTQKRAVVTHDWHLIRNVVPEGTTELYRRAADPKEEHDLAGVGLDAERTLMAELAAWMDAIALPPDFARRVAGNVQQKPFAPRQPLGDTLGGFVTLDGVDVDTPTVKPGGAVEVALYLHATEKPAAGWRLFTHVLGAGRMINADHEPVQGTLPLARLAPGTYVRDRIRVNLPLNFPPGPLSIRVGLWRGRERAKAAGAHSSSDNAVDVARVTVAP